TVHRARGTALVHRCRQNRGVDRIPRRADRASCAAADDAVELSVSLKHGTERPAEVEAKQGLVSGALPLKCGTGPLMMRLTGSRATRGAVNGNPGKSSVVATGRGEPVPELKVQSPQLSRQSHH